MHDPCTSLLVWIPLLPLFGALVNGLLGRKLPRTLVGALACSTVGGSFVLALIASVPVLAAHGQGRLVQELGPWISVPGLVIPFRFLVDSLAVVMLLVVSGVSLLIHIYSLGYMKSDPSYSRYFAYLNLFVCAMLILVLADNLPLLFVGWEGVGLCSYLLIGFWFEDPAKASAGKKAFVVNRIGDLGFLLGMFVLFGAAGSLSIDGLRQAAENGEITTALATVACLLLFVGAAGKSAQIPLYVWLPDAMAGPTPVSALIHAATMVTAGVYLIARLSFLFALAPTASAIVALVGGATALFAATIGVVQTDIKKVLAYSTVSQLGYMFVGVGVGSYSAGVFHLMTHAFFKACLFLGAGAVIHALSGEQDIRRMGGLKKKLPWTYWTFLIATLAIAGFPPLSGFFSKDEILWKALSSDSHAAWAAGWVHLLAYGLGLVGAGLTSFYMFRLVFLTFHGSSRLDPAVHVHHESGVMSGPLVVLAGLAMVGGLVGAALFGVRTFEHFLDPVVGEAEKIAVVARGFAHSSGAEIGAALGSVLLGLLGLVMAYTCYLARPALPGRIAQRLSSLHRLLLNKYWVDELYERVIVRPIAALALVLWKKVDELIIDTFLVHGPGRMLLAVAAVGRKMQNGDVQAYAFWLFFGLCGLGAYLLWNLGMS